MIGYVCKYAPLEIFEAMGTETGRIQPQVTNFNQADTLMHPNVCSFAKAVLEEVMGNDVYEGLVLTTCCDSMRRLYDNLKEQFPDKFIYICDVPRKVTGLSVKVYEKSLRRMIAAYEEFSGKTFQEDALFNLLERKKEAEKLKKTPEKKKKKIGLMGARASAGVINLLENHEAEVLFDLTCTGIQRKLGAKKEQVLFSYAESLLNQIPCMRMQKAVNRENYLEGFKDELDGIIYHTVKFCDNFGYEYAWLKERIGVPLLLVETDATKQCEGQIRTRVEAFLESLDTEGKKVTGRKKSMEDGHMYVLGIDSGSTSTNAVIINEKEEILASHVIRTGAKSGESAERIFREVLEKAGLAKENLDLVVSTGYGRVSIDFADENITEITCHGRGAHYFNPSVHTILDIGGQDSKAIHLSDSGEVTDFVMNDKCAAGTGRFLEMMARTLEIGIDELGPISLQWKEDITISSMCSVFAESEVISLIARNKEKPDIAHGIHKAIANKAVSLMKRVGLEEGYMMTGGVAKNPGVVKVVEEKLGASLYICEEPEIVGALGAALLGLEGLQKKD